MISLVLVGLDFKDMSDGEARGGKKTSVAQALTLEIDTLNS